MNKELLHSRNSLLVYGLDIKMILERFLQDLEYAHGTKRAERFISWIDGTPVSSLSWWNRMELRADRRRLNSIIRQYRAG